MPNVRPKPILFPLRGVDYDTPKGARKPQTASDARNMRATDPVTQRSRGASRSGTSPRFGGQYVNGTFVPVKELHAITFNRKVLTYTEASVSTDVSLEWSEPSAAATSETNLGPVDLQFDDQGALYVLEPSWGFSKYSPEGGLVGSWAVPLPLNVTATSLQLRAFCVDPVTQDVYVGVGANGSAAQSTGRLWRFRRDVEGNYSVAWEYNSGNWIQACCIVSGALFVAEWDVSGSTGLLRRFDDGAGPIVPALPASLETTTPEAPRGMAVAEDFSCYVALYDMGAPAEIDLHKYAMGGSQASLVWTLNGMGTSYSANKGGVGFDVKIGPDGALYSFGQFAAASAGEPQTNVRKVIDNGDSQTSDGTGGSWSTALPGGLDYPASSDILLSLRMDVDANGNAYVPYSLSGGGAKFAYVFANADGSLVLDIDNSGQTKSSMAVAVPKINPEYGTDSITLAETAVVAGIDIALERDVLYTFRLVDVQQTQRVAPRETRVVGLAGGSIRELSLAGETISTIDSGGPSTGESVYDGLAPVVMATELFGKLYIVDGRNDLIYDPRALEDGGLSALGGVERWTALAGRLQPKCRIVETWRARVLRTGDPENPQNWYFSASGDARDYDYRPGVSTPVDAVAGNNSPAGLCPSLVNGFIPWSEDLGVFGGDDAIWLLTGDPKSGGEFDQLYRAAGMAFGRAWCLDPWGGAWWVGSKGGVFRLTRGKGVERMTFGRIERQMQDNLDLENYYVRLYWNWWDEGLHVWQFPYDVHDKQVLGWFYDAKNDGWWPDDFQQDPSNPNPWRSQPTAGVVVDSDRPQERRMFLGLGDGTVVEWDRDASNDSGRAVDSWVEFGPEVALGSPSSWRFNKWHFILDDTQHGCELELYADAPVLGQARVPRWRHDLVPGINPYLNYPVRGHDVRFRLRNAAVGQRFAFEGGSLRAERMGHMYPKAGLK